VNSLGWLSTWTLVKKWEGGREKGPIDGLIDTYDIDFTPLFNWNTKQVFVTVVAEYESKTHVGQQGERAPWIG
jgi:hypothetical protein